MPLLEVVSRSEAVLRTAGRARAKVLREYLDFIEGLNGDQAGKLQPRDGETPRAVRRRLGDAAKLAGKELVIKRDGDTTHFWLKPSPRGRGRPRKRSA